MHPPTVIIRACPDYDVERIRRIVGEGLDALDLRPFGRTLVKPNVVASGDFFPHAFTRSEFVEGVLLALRDRDEKVTELAVGERSGITIPTRLAFKQAGYYPMADRVNGVELVHFEEVSQVRVPLYHEGRLRDFFFTPETVARADFMVNCPKFKAHPWTTVTFSMKNYIGIQDDRHRLIDHDHQLDRKVADLQYITQAGFVAIDAIVAGEGRMLTPLPYDLGLVIMGNNQVAVDAVCCRIAGIDPMTVDHIRLAWERGFGPVDGSAIRLLGDVTPEGARERAATFKTGLIRVEDYFAGTSIRAYAGPPPGGTSDYCWGGCPGAMEEAIEILRVFDKATDAKMPPIHIVFGRYEGAIEAREGEKVVFIGDCAEFHGQVGGTTVDMENLYVDRAHKDPLQARHEDIFVKMAKVAANTFWNRRSQVIRLKGCPVSVAEQVLALVYLGGIDNPYLEPTQVTSFVSSYLSWKTRVALKRLLGNPYNDRAIVVRGESRPALNLPPPGFTTPYEAPAVPRLPAPVSGSE